MNSTPFHDVYQYPEPEFTNRPCQGDIFKRELIEFEIKDYSSIYGYIILNSSCDLIKPRLDYFFFAPIRPLEYFIEKSGYKTAQLKDYVSKIVKYDMLRTFFLPPSSKFKLDIPLYCQLGYIFSIPVGENYDITCENLLKFRIISLKPPWREKLGQLIGNNFSRIGVPEPSSSYKRWTNNIIEKV